MTPRLLSVFRRLATPVDEIRAAYQDPTPRVLRFGAFAGGDFPIAHDARIRSTKARSLGATSGVRG